MKNLIVALIALTALMPTTASAQEDWEDDFLQEFGPEDRSPQPASAGATGPTGATPATVPMVKPKKASGPSGSWKLPKLPDLAPNTSVGQDGLAPVAEDALKSVLYGKDWAVKKARAEAKAKAEAEAKRKKEKGLLGRAWSGIFGESKPEPQPLIQLPEMDKSWYENIPLIGGIFSWFKWGGDLIDLLRRVLLLALFRFIAKWRRGKDAEERWGPIAGALLALITLNGWWLLSGGVWWGMNYPFESNLKDSKRWLIWPARAIWYALAAALA